MSHTGHLVVETLAGSATVTMHLRTPWGCAPLATAVLDPADVLELAAKLTAASVPPPPVVRKRIDVRRMGGDRWVVQCPECFPMPGSFTSHAAAIDGAYRHLRTEHASEVSR